MTAELHLYIIKYGYLAIFILIFLQEIGVPNPIPNELVLFFSGYLAFSGILKLPIVILIAVLADFTGTNILYFVFLFFGAYIIQNKPRWFPISQRVITNVTLRVSHGNKWTIYLGRLTPFLRGYTSVITGLLQIKPKVFLPIAFFSALTWSTFYVIAGNLSAPYVRSFTNSSVNLMYIMLYLVSVIIVVIIIKFYRNRSIKKSADSSSDNINP